MQDPAANDNAADHTEDPPCIACGAPESCHDEGCPLEPEPPSENHGGINDPRN